MSIGDFLPIAHAGSAKVTLARVTGVKERVEIGVYMPHTLTGAIVVDGVVATELTTIAPPVGFQNQRDYLKHAYELHNFFALV